MKRLLTAVAILLIATALPINAKEVTCRGEIYRSTPPVPNHPANVRNVIWRNAQTRRDACRKNAETSKKTLLQE
ncbi:hypothetical protein DO97_06965 [Neosynechococcus sphagnicola sy1]|uniref:Uncharacterized protein n=1 Tax=Neosynechococcus sphagnicola sy1 TaxID=1497020 RepID=A0A098TPA0_9CYAN|nr:hypothetical protein [Neosynechococcus sphagnicola]KGF72658.1 hypothetical protein DO97_06965 [Neosynechococcus sphagnicola sy1]